MSAGKTFENMWAQPQVCRTIFITGRSFFLFFFSLRHFKHFREICKRGKEEKEVLEEDKEVLEEEEEKRIHDPLTFSFAFSLLV